MILYIYETHRMLYILENKYFGDNYETQHLSFSLVLATFVLATFFFQQVNVASNYYIITKN